MYVCMYVCMYACMNVAYYNFWANLRVNTSENVTINFVFIRTLMCKSINTILGMVSEQLYNYNKFISRSVKQLNSHLV